MKLVRYGGIGSERPGVWLDDGRIVDVAHVTVDLSPAFLAGGGVALLHEAADPSRPGAQVIDGASVRLGPPVPRPGKVVCIGLNYLDHAPESGMDAPPEPIVFMKAPSTDVGPRDQLLLPVGGEKVDWEVELSVVLRAEARYLECPDDAAGVIAGYCSSNDVSERAWQLERGGQWVKGKSCETFNPLGPWLVTPDEVGDPQDLRMELAVNGEVMQQSSTATMIFGGNHLIWYISQFMVLEPGDLVNTGTPAGVGLGRTPPRFLQPGDVVDASIDRLGAQRFECARAERTRAERKEWAA